MTPGIAQASSRRVSLCTTVCLRVTTIADRRPISDTEVGDQEGSPSRRRQPGIVTIACTAAVRDPLLCAPRGRQAFLNWRVQNERSFWSTSIGTAEVAALQTVRKYPLTCIATAPRRWFGTHSAHAEPDGFAFMAGLWAMRHVCLADSDARCVPLTQVVGTTHQISNPVVDHAPPGDEPGRWPHDDPALT